MNLTVKIVNNFIDEAIKKANLATDKDFEDNRQSWIRIYVPSKNVYRAFGEVTPAYSRYLGRMRHLGQSIETHHYEPIYSTQRKVIVDLTDPNSFDKLVEVLNSWRLYEIRSIYRRGHVIP